VKFLVCQKKNGMYGCAPGSYHACLSTQGSGKGLVDTPMRCSGVVAEKARKIPVVSVGMISV
jgi:hypothetical protein